MFNARWIKKNLVHFIVIAMGGLWVFGNAKHTYKVFRQPPLEGVV